MNIAIIGTGNIGSGLAVTLGKTKHGVVLAGSDASSGPDAAAKLNAEHGLSLQGTDVAQAVKLAEVVILAVPFPAIAGLADTADFNGKIVVDVSNPVTEDFSGLAIGHSTSAAEETAKALSGARVVKAFNTVFAQVYADGLDFGDRKLPTYVASDDEAARATVLAIAADAGFDPVDTGALASARHLEPLGYLNIQFGYMLGHGTQIAPAWLSR